MHQELTKTKPTDLLLITVIDVQVAAYEICAQDKCWKSKANADADEAEIRARFAIKWSIT
jgi:hypothetical protein